MNLQNMDPIATRLGTWSSSLCLACVLFRFALSMLLSALVGWERSSKRHSAGLRTFILVSIASTTAMILELYLAEIGGSSISLLSAAAIIGSAILSINSIQYSSRGLIRGLTTATGLWTCGIIGLTAGAGFYTATLTAFIALLASLSLFPVLEAYLKNRSNHFEIHLELTSSSYLRDFVTTIRELGMTVDDIEANTAYLGSGLSVYTVCFSIRSEELKKYRTHEQIIQALGTLDYVYYVEEMRH